MPVGVLAFASVSRAPDPARTIPHRRKHLHLFYSPAACSLAPHIVAREAGIPVTLVKVDLATKMTETGEDLRSINPKGAIPTLLLDDGTVLTEGAVISQFLADMAPGSGLLPAQGSSERYRALEWLNYIATELHKGFGPLWRKDTPEGMREIAKTMLGSKFEFLDRHLAERENLLGTGFSAADAYAFTILSWAPAVGIDLARWPRLAAYVQRVSERPHVRAALFAEGLLEAEVA
jgi:glutathione S-transferase